MSDTNNIVFDCPECRQGIKAPADLAGDMAACPNCGKDVKVPGSVSKQEDFVPPLPSHPQLVSLTPPSIGNTLPINKKSNGMAIAGLVLGIISVIPGFFCGGPIWAILGIIFSSIAMRRISKKPDQYEGEGLAVAGLITSIVGLMISLIALSMLGFMGATMTTILAAFADALSKLPK
jgi:hypothetical protein